MDLGRPHWLSRLLEEALSEWAQAKREQPARVRASGRSVHAQARNYLQTTLEQGGLLSGAREAGAKGAKQPPPEEQLFFREMKAFARLALEIADIAGAPPEEPAAQLVLLFAALTGDLETGKGRKSAGGRWVEPASSKLLAAVETSLEERALSFGGDPAYGLMLHNGVVYSDAQVFGRNAIELFVTGRLRVRAADRRRLVGARRKALLVRVLAALACVERRPIFSARRAILRQVEDLKLPPSLGDELREQLRRCFERPPPIKKVVAKAHSRPLRRFLLEQTLLASLVDGLNSPREAAFLRELAVQLGYSPAEVGALRAHMAEFYAAHRSAVDVFTNQPGAELFGEELVGSVEEVLEKNFRRLMNEVKETGELSVLLAKAARGQNLSAQEKRRMRAQLYDLAKVVPALAVFAAPGGVLLLIALAKLLGVNLLPSSFQEEGEDPEGQAHSGRS